MEKLVSVSAGLGSAAFTQACGEPAHFDSRIWQSKQRDEVIDYFRWRQSDTARSALHAWCYWTLRKTGISSEEAVQILDGKDKDDQKALLSKHGIDFDRVPLWQRRGAGFYWQDYEKRGYNPLKGETVMAQQRHIKHNAELPAGERHSEFLERLFPQHGSIAIGTNRLLGFDP